MISNNRDEDTKQQRLRHKIIEIKIQNNRD